VIRLFPESAARVRSLAERFPRAFWVLLAGEGVQSLGFGIAVPFIALYLTNTVGISPAQTGVSVAAWSLTGVLGQPLGGLLSDRLGRRPVMLVGLAGAGITSVAYGLVGTFWQVIAVTVAWALFNTVFRPAAAAYLADVVEPGLRTEGFSLLRIVQNGFFAAGPPLGALVIWLVSLRATYLLAGMAILAYCAIAWTALAESRPRGREGEPPARMREALRDRVLVLLALGTGTAMLAYAFFDDALPVFMHEERGLGIVTWGLVFGINPILVMLAQYPIGRWAARRSGRAVLALGALLQGAALAILLPSGHLAVLVAAVVVLTAGEMLISPVSAALAADLAPVRLRGSYQGVLNLAAEGAWGPSALLGLWLVGRGQGEIFLALALPLGALAAAAYLALPGGRLKQEPVLASADPVRP
jgi:MFS family permease